MKEQSMSQETMNPELKAKWVAALRSGEYKQGAGKLRKGNAYCCLGVLCDVVDPTRWRAVFGPDYAYDDRIFYPPDELLQSLRVDVDASRYVANTMNDQEHRAFPEIADWIEANL